MSQTIIAASEAAPVDDPFYYGWRYVTRLHRENGEEWEETVLVPLTYDDMLHPEEGDIVAHTPLHHRICAYLVAVIESWARSQSGVVVLPDVRIEWDIPDLKAHGPDIAVIFGVREPQNWGTFSVAEEGTRPTLIIEVTSPKTRSGDLVTKLDEYEIAGVPFYIVVDTAARGQPGGLRLLGYHKVGPSYTVMAPNEHGWLWMEPVRLWIGIDNEQVVCYDATGNLIPDYVELAEARSEAETRAAAAESRVHELEAELRRLRGEP